MGPTWGPPGSCRPQMGRMMAPMNLVIRRVLKRRSDVFTTVRIASLRPPGLGFNESDCWNRMIDAACGECMPPSVAFSRCLKTAMMTSSNGNIFCVTGPLCGDRTPVNCPQKGQWHGALMFSLICAWINGWVNHGEAGDLRRHRDHYDVTVMVRHSADVWRMQWCRGAENVFTLLATA